MDGSEQVALIYKTLIVKLSWLRHRIFSFQIVNRLCDAKTNAKDLLRITRMKFRKDYLKNKPSKLNNISDKQSVTVLKGKCVLVCNCRDPISIAIILISRSCLFCKAVINEISAIYVNDGN